ncbi:MAG: SGNH/GDSL hydrolase family protein [Planctomycetales bacterium]|nr:SGNH/GDSL hydrolase family protein [Planctomycetales bacterium]
MSHFKFDAIKVSALMLALALTPFVSAQDVAADFPASVDKIELADGDTLVFLGDSITHQCLYTQYVEDFFYTRYPSARIRFHNSGVGGDRANDALVRFDRDVAEWKPKYVTILLGMNDGTYTRFEQGVFDTYEADMTTLLDRIKDAGAIAIPMTPTMFDSRAARIRDKGKSGRELRDKYYNGVLAFYGAWLREQAQTRGLGFVDMYSPLNNLTIQERKRDPSFTMIADAVHPGAAGQAVMAFAILNDMHVNRSVTSLNAQKVQDKWTVTAQNGEVSEVGDGEELSFTFKANSLPWVLPEEAALGYDLTKAGHKMSNERFRVTGLAPGQYQLKIDGEPVGSYSHLQLQFKIELQGNQRTPQYQQALEVAMRNKLRNDEAVRPLRNTWGRMKRERRTLNAIKEGDADAAEKRAAFAKWEEEFNATIAKHIERAKELENEIYELNQPKPRTYTLTRVVRQPRQPLKVEAAK